MLPDPTARLRAVPFQALDGLGGLVCEALEPVLRGAPAERALDRLLRAHKGFSRDQRAAVAESVFGVALWRRRLAIHAGLPDAWFAALPLASSSPPPPASGPPQGGALRRDDQLSSPCPAPLLAALLRDLAGLDEPTARRLSSLGDAPLGHGTPGTWRQRWSFPDALADVLDRALGPAAPLFARAACSPGPVILRANTLRTTRDDLAALLRAAGLETRPTPHAPHGLLVDTPRPNLLGTDAHGAGLFEPQDEGSQLLGALVEARPGDVVLDACAGAGGKSLLLACAVGASGEVLCQDIDSTRLSRLAARAFRAGATAVRLVPPDTQAPGQLVDRALVDAPCSELGPLRRGPDARHRLDPRTFAALPALQLGLLVRAAARVQPGGRLVYATCTVRPEENQEVAQDFERAHPAFARVRPGTGWLSEDFVAQDAGGHHFRALPHLHGTDGFFAAVWDKVS